MGKYAIIAIVSVAAYFLVFKDPYPDTIKFQGHSFSSKEDINDTLNDLDIFKYRDVSNNHNLMFAISKDKGVTLTDLSDIYINMFERQGYNFKEQDDKYLGINADTKIYMAESKNIKGVVVYIAKADSAAPTKIEDATSIFFDIESFTL